MDVGTMTAMFETSREEKKGLTLESPAVRNRIARDGLARIAKTRPAALMSRSAAKLVSVGNLVVGGSGKTPLAAWLAAALRKRGHRVVLASRGYGRRGGDAVEVVSDGRHVLSSAERAGDEPMLLAAHAPDVPVLVGRDRAVRKTDFASSVVEVANTIPIS